MEQQCVCGSVCTKGSIININALVELNPAQSWTIAHLTVWRSHKTALATWLVAATAVWNAPGDKHKFKVKYTIHMQCFTAAPLYRLYQRNPDVATCAAFAANGRCKLGFNEERSCGSKLWPLESSKTYEKVALITDNDKRLASAGYNERWWCQIWWILQILVLGILKIAI